jgi:hypothetical protein
MRKWSVGAAIVAGERGKKFGAKKRVFFLTLLLVVTEDCCRFCSDTFFSLPRKHGGQMFCEKKWPKI